MGSDGRQAAIAWAQRFTTNEGHVIAVIFWMTVKD